MVAATQLRMARVRPLDGNGGKLRRSPLGRRRGKYTFPLARDGTIGGGAPRKAPRPTTIRSTATPHPPGNPTPQPAQPPWSPISRTGPDPPVRKDNPPLAGSFSRSSGTPARRATIRAAITRPVADHDGSAIRTARRIYLLLKSRRFVGNCIPLVSLAFKLIEKKKRGFYSHR